MRIPYLSVFATDQDAALDFYTRVLGFLPGDDVPLGEHRWITLRSPEDPDGTRLLIEPADHPAVAPFRAALAADGIPWTALAVSDVRAEHERLTALGVVFTQPPVEAGGVTTAVLDDTVGNLVQLVSGA